MEVETKAGWVNAVQQLGKAVGENGGGEVTSNDITDATGVGKNVITAATQEAARAAIGAVSSEDIPEVPVAPTWNTLSGKPTVIAAGATEAAARQAIGAGTSSLALGTTASTAMAGDTPIPDAATWANLTGKPATFPPTIGTTAQTAKAGNYTPTTNEVSASLKAKAEIAALAEIADPTTATSEDVATAINAIIAALKA